MISKQELDILLENKEFDKINLMFLDEFKNIFAKLTDTQNLHLSYSTLVIIMKNKYPEITERLNFLDYLFSDDSDKNYEKTYNLLNLYLNFVKFYSL